MNTIMAIVLGLQIAGMQPINRAHLAQIRYELATTMKLGSSVSVFDDGSITISGDQYHGQGIDRALNSGGCYIPEWGCSPKEARNGTPNGTNVCRDG